MDHILQQDIPKENLLTILKTRGPTGSYLFTGCEGVGKRMAALFFARVANCLSPSKKTGYCGKCEWCLKAHQTSVTHPDIVLIENAEHPAAVDRLSVMEKLGIKNEDDYFDSADFLFEKNLLLKPLERFQAEKPLDFFYRNPAMIVEKETKLSELYKTILEKKKPVKTEVTASKLIHELFLGHSRGSFQNSIKIGTIKSLITQTVSFKPLQLKYKFYIIDDAHLMTDEAQNALLKILEEPPSNTIFILISALSHNLYPTILSRTNKIYFQPISSSHITAELISKRGQTLENAQVISAYVKGNLSDALLFDSAAFFAEREIVLESLRSVSRSTEYSWSRGSRSFLRGSFAGNREFSGAVTNRLHILSGFFQDAAMFFHNISSRRNFADLAPGLFTELFPDISLDQIMDISSFIENSLEGISSNHDILLTVEELFIKINKAAG